MVGILYGIFPQNILHSVLLLTPSVLPLLPKCGKVVEIVYLQISDVVASLLVTHSGPVRLGPSHTTVYDRLKSTVANNILVTKVT